MNDNSSLTLEKLQEQAAMFRAIRKLMGFIQDGSSDTVHIGQDDATGDYYVRRSGHTEYNSCLEKAIQKQISFWRL